MSGRGTRALEVLRAAGVAHVVHEYAPVEAAGSRDRRPHYGTDAAAALATLFVSAGRRGLQVEVSPADLARLTGARLAPIARPA